MVNYRYLGNSGLKVSEITYGNWVTHGSQVDDAAAIATVHAALDAGITTFDTADVYANTAAETVLGKALAGQRRESLEIFTKVYWPTGPKGPNDTGLSRKHIMESINGSLTRLGTDYVDLYQAHRYDYETPIEETFQAFADVVRQGKALYIGVSEWTAEQLREGHALAEELRHPAHLEPAAVLDAVARDRGQGRAGLGGARHLADRLVADGAGRAQSGKYLPGQPVPEGSRATDEKSGADFIKRFLDDDVLDGRAAAEADRRRRPGSRCRSSRSRGCCRTRTSRPRWSGHRAPSSSRERSRPRA